MANSGKKTPLVNKNNNVDIEEGGCNELRFWKLFEVHYLEKTQDQLLTTAIEAGRELYPYITLTAADNF